MKRIVPKVNVIIMARNVMFVLLVLFGVFVSNVHLANHRAQSERDHEKRECEEITVPMCRGIGYNLTSMPNQFHHETQEEAGLEGKLSKNKNFFYACKRFTLPIDGH